MNLLLLCATLFIAALSSGTTNFIDAACSDYSYKSSCNAISNCGWCDWGCCIYYYGQTTCSSSQCPSSSSSSSSSSSDATGGIIGGVVGGVCLILLIIWIANCNKSKGAAAATKPTSVTAVPVTATSPVQSIRVASTAEQQQMFQQQPFAGSMQYPSLGTVQYPPAGAMQYPFVGSGSMQYPMAGSMQYPMAGQMQFPTAGQTGTTTNYYYGGQKMYP